MNFQSEAVQINQDVQITIKTEEFRGDLNAAILS
jgi:hypothetical protein